MKRLVRENPVTARFVVLVAALAVVAQVVGTYAR